MNTNAPASPQRLVMPRNYFRRPIWDGVFFTPPCPPRRPCRFSASTIPKSPVANRPGADYFSGMGTDLIQIIITPDQAESVSAFGDDVRFYLGSRHPGNAVTMFSDVTPPGGVTSANMVTALPG